MVTTASCSRNLDSEEESQGHSQMYTPSQGSGRNRNSGTSTEEGEASESDADLNTSFGSVKILPRSKADIDREEGGILEGKGRNN